MTSHSESWCYYLEFCEHLQEMWSLFSELLVIKLLKMNLNWNIKKNRKKPLHISTYKLHYVIYQTSPKCCDNIMWFKEKGYLAGKLLCSVKLRYLNCWKPQGTEGTIKCLLFTNAGCSSVHRKTWQKSNKCDQTKLTGKLGCCWGEYDIDNRANMLYWCNTTTAKAHSLTNKCKDTQCF